MNTNQLRALELARSIVRGRVQSADDLPDRDWALLLLAADLQSPFSHLPIVARRVVNQAAERTGYFAGADWPADRDRYTVRPDRSPGTRSDGRGGRPGDDRSAGRAGRAAPARVLVVDDHDDTLQLLRVVFQRGGFDVRTARTAGAARRSAGEQRFELLVSETTLPDGDGCDLLADVSRLHPVRSVALTARGMPNDLARYALAGYDSVLLKPVALDELWRVIDDLMADASCTLRNG